MKINFFSLLCSGVQVVLFRDFHFFLHRCFRCGSVGTCLYACSLVFSSAPVMLFWTRFSSTDHDRSVCSLKVSLTIGYCKSSNFFLLYQDCLDYSISLDVYIYFRNSLSSALKISAGFLIEIGLNSSSI